MPLVFLQRDFPFVDHPNGSHLLRRPPIAFDLTTTPVCRRLSNHPQGRHVQLTLSDSRYPHRLRLLLTEKGGVRLDTRPLSLCVSTLYRIHSGVCDKESHSLPWPSPCTSPVLPSGPQPPPPPPHPCPVSLPWGAFCVLRRVWQVKRSPLLPRTSTSCAASPTMCGPKTIPTTDGGWGQLSACLSSPRYY